MRTKTSKSGGLRDSAGEDHGIGESLANSTLLTITYGAFLHGVTTSGFLPLPQTIANSAILAKTDGKLGGIPMKTLTAKDAKYGFGRLIDLARAEPVAVAKHGRPVVVVMAVEEFERLKALDKPKSAKRPRLLSSER